MFFIGKWTHFVENDRETCYYIVEKATILCD